MCSSHILGVRYKCTNCPDYDVCESCFRISDEVHPGHSFVKVHKREDIIVSVVLYMNGKLEVLTDSM
jgi:hypothetical protein